MCVCVCNPFWGRGGGGGGGGEGGGKQEQAEHAGSVLHTTPVRGREAVVVDGFGLIIIDSIQQCMI